MLKKRRVDQLLVEKGLASSRTKAQALVMAGLVYSGERKIEKSSELFSIANPLHVREGLRYVSRGGLKLEEALKKGGIDVRGKVALDIGASTGGFTDCLLQAGAKKVYAVDVGYGQLDSKLKGDPRVVNIEKVNIRYLDPQLIQDPIEIVTLDLSFISLSKVFPKVFEIVRTKATMMALVKPQFEVGKGEVGKGGLVKDSQKHEAVLEKIKTILKAYPVGEIQIFHSPILGQKGNQEFLLVTEIRA